MDAAAWWAWHELQVYWLQQVLVLNAVIGYVLLAREKPTGWLVNIGNQFVWVAFALVAHQFPFLESAAFFLVVNSYGFLLWRQKRRRAEAQRTALAALRAAIAESYSSSDEWPEPLRAEIARLDQGRAA